MPQFDCCTSDLAVLEIEQTQDPDLRFKMRELLKGFQIHPVTDEMRVLADRYVEAGAFTRLMLNDAFHVAAATLTRQDILISWNFKHLVNRRRRAIVSSVNTNLGLPAIDILSPPEI